MKCEQRPLFLSFGQKGYRFCKFFLLLVAKGKKKAIIWIVQWIRTKGSHLSCHRAVRRAGKMCCTSSNGATPLSPPIRWHYCGFPGPCWEWHHAACLMNRILPLCCISQRQVGMFLPFPQSCSLRQSWKQYKVILTPSSRMVSRAGSEAEEQLLENFPANKIQKKD